MFAFGTFPLPPLSLYFSILPSHHHLRRRRRHQPRRLLLKRTGRRPRGRRKRRRSTDDTPIAVEKGPFWGIDRLVLRIYRAGKNKTLSGIHLLNIILRDKSFNFQVTSYEIDLKAN